MTAGTIIAADEGAVRVLTISRPQRRNALDVAAATQLRAELERAQAEPGVGAVVLAGAGEHFCAGGDAADILAHTGGDEAPLALMRTFHRLVEEIWNADLPVVAAVAGVAYGGGFNLALACDLIVCAQDARLCQVFLRRGVVPDVGGAYLLPRLVGLQRARALMLLCPELSAPDALRLGLVTEVAASAQAARARAVELAAQLAAGPRLAVRLAKKLLNTSTDGDLHSSLELEAVTQALALHSQDARAGFESFLRKAPGAPPVT